jgi:hypothetical protein
MGRAAVVGITWTMTIGGLSDGLIVSSEGGSCLKQDDRPSVLALHAMPCPVILRGLPNIRG